jgi:hypothetical protein
MAPIRKEHQVMGMVDVGQKLLDAIGGGRI